eukprot:7132698-Prymnesium_polylepis.1
MGKCERVASMRQSSAMIRVWTCTMSNQLQRVNCRPSATATSRIAFSERLERGCSEIFGDWDWTGSGNYQG